MADLLIVEADEEMVVGLRRACRAAGVHADAVRDGAEALSSLDWHPPQAILCAGRLPDMAGWELCSVVRSDPKTARIHFVLLLDPADLRAPEAQRCGATLLAPRLGALAVVPDLLPRLLHDRVSPVSTGGGPNAASTLHGCISMLGLPDLVQAIAASGRAGRLVVSLGDGDGTLFFTGGRVVDAESGGHTGEAGVADLMARAEGASATFVFLPGAEHPDRAPIRKTVPQLLLGVATDLDRRRAHLIGDGTPSPTAS